jgi:hypothetical protein
MISGDGCSRAVAGAWAAVRGRLQPKCRRAWFWSLYGVVGRPPKVHMNGDAATLDEAKAQLESTWQQWLAWARLQEMP